MKHARLQPRPEAEETLQRELSKFFNMRMTDELRAQIRFVVRQHAPGMPVVFLSQGMHVGFIRAELFEMLTGRAPDQDDLDRVNCSEVGQPGHGLCGICETHDLPRLHCWCRNSHLGDG